MKKTYFLTVFYTISVQVDITLFPNSFYLTDLFGDVIVLCLKRGRYWDLGKRVNFLHGHGIGYRRETHFFVFKYSLFSYYPSTYIYL